MFCSVLFYYILFCSALVLEREKETKNSNGIYFPLPPFGQKGQKGTTRRKTNQEHNSPSIHLHAIFNSPSITIFR